MPGGMATSGDSGDRWDLNAGLEELSQLQHTSNQLKSIHDILWEEVCKEDELAKKNHIRTLGKLRALDLELHEELVGKDSNGNVKEAPVTERESGKNVVENDDVVVENVCEVDDSPFYIDFGHI